MSHWWLQWHVAWSAMGLDNLAQDAEGRAAIIGAGAIPPLVALLSMSATCQAPGMEGDPKSMAAHWAAGALSWLADYKEDMKLNEASRSAIVVAGAIPVLVALLRTTVDDVRWSGAPEAAAYVLSDLVLSDLVYHTAVLEELARTQTKCWGCLRLAMCQSASGRLVVAGVQQAITLASAVRVHAAAQERAEESLQELNGDAERHQARLESFGLGSLELPEEFVCPITWANMRGVPPPRLAASPRTRHACPTCAVADPVVASDGHTYERSAILSVFRGDMGLSPLTREPLLPNVLIVNRNLKRRMQEHQEDMLHVAATAVANASHGTQQQGPAAGRGEPSSEPASTFGVKDLQVSHS